jgi:hypothetical protein
MLETLAAMVAFYGLILLLQALGKLRQMQEINKNGVSVPGTVMRANVSGSMMTGHLGGTGYATIIRYLPNGDREPLEIHISDHSLWMAKEYSEGEMMEIVYDAKAHHHAYPKMDWQKNIKDLWSAGIAFGLALAMLAFRWLVIG